MAEEKRPPTAIGKLLQDMPADQADKVIESIVGVLEATIRKTLPPAIDKALPPAIDKVLHDLGFTEEVAGLVQLLAARSNDSKEDVLEKALTLYGVALDAREKGNRLAILSPDDVIVHDIIGFEPVETAR